MHEGVQEPQKKENIKEPAAAAESINAESVVAGMAAPLQALRELLLWPIMYAKEAKSLGLRVRFLHLCIYHI